MINTSLAQEIDALLPQTQCGQCGYGGCLPYAKAIADKQEEINRCPPGGIKTLQALGKLVHRDVSPFLAEMEAQQKPLQLAKIRENECIGCTKCIKACPVDAIVGAAKQLHTVLETECTGCGLCVTPCPVDCIDLIAVEQLNYQPLQAKRRFNARAQRQNNLVTTEKNDITTKQEEADKKAYLQAAILRAKQKRADC